MLDLLEVVVEEWDVEPTRAQDMDIVDYEIREMHALRHMSYVTVRMTRYIVGRESGENGESGHQLHSRFHQHLDV